jgi:predicted Rossmann fold flavoprotein
MSEKPLTIVVAGGGAAGFFAALACAHHFPQHRVIILEKTRQPLAKVRISGGGRCNVTHACFDPIALVKFYPRGQRELRGPLTRFQPLQTIEWFEQRGVRLKAEADGRMFPVTDNSQTIINCLLNEAEKLQVDLQLEKGIQAIGKLEQGFKLTLSNDEELRCDRLLLATGSAPKSFQWLQTLGHTIVPLVPSLFTFNLPGSSFLDLAGISVAKATVKLPVV